MQQLKTSSDQPKTRPAHCDKHGGYLATNYIGNIWSKCPKCEKEQQERSQERSRLSTITTRSNVPPKDKRRSAGILRRYQSCSFDNFLSGQCKIKRNALDVCQQYAIDLKNNTDQNLVLLGSVGTGKTHLACAIAGQMIDGGKKVLYTTTARLMQQIKQGYGNSDSSVMTLAASCDLLIIDEIDISTGSSAHDSATVADILCQRYDDCLPSILISNLTPSDINVAFGDRMISRLKGAGGPRVVLSGQDWRSKVV